MSDISELEKISYAKAHDLVAHYSGIIFKTRVSVFTLSILLLALLFGVKISVPKIVFGLDQSTLKAILSLIYSFSITLFFNLETGYFRRLCRIVGAAKGIEEKYRFEGCFSNYNTTWHWPLHLIYISMITVYVLIFIFITTRLFFPLPWAIFVVIFPYIFFFLVASKSPRVSKYQPSQPAEETVPGA